MFFDIILPTIRRRFGKSFRKTLGVYSYKMGDKTHKKPGVIPLNVKQKLISVLISFFLTKRLTMKDPSKLSIYLKERALIPSENSLGRVNFFIMTKQQANLFSIQQECLYIMYLISLILKYIMPFSLIV